MRVELSSERVGVIPPFRSFAVHGTEGVSDDEWKRVASIPGAFFVDGDDDIPASGNIAFTRKVQTGRWPDPVYVPYAQRKQLDTIFPFQEPVPAASLYDAQGDVHSLPNAGDELFRFQSEAARQFLSEKRMLLLTPVGSGKTIVPIFAGEELRRRKAIDRIVVVSPRGLMRSRWQPELLRFYGIDPVVIEGTPTRRYKLWATGTACPWVLSKYDTWRTDKWHIQNILGPRTMVVIEEVHHLKNPTTQRWRAIRDLLDRNGVEYRMFLTGTLLYDKPADAFGPVSLLGLRVWNTYAEFRDRYFSVDRFPTGRTGRWGEPIVIESIGELKGPSEAKELRDVIDTVSFRRTSKDIGFDLPLLREDIRIVEATPEEEALYRLIVTVPLSEIGATGVYGQETERRLLSTISMERLFVSDPSLVTRSKSDTAKRIVEHLGANQFDEASPGSKMHALIEFLGDFLSEDETSKVVVFSQLEDIYEVLNGWLGRSAGPRNIVRIPGFDEEERETLAQIHDASVFYHGEIPQKTRDENLGRFIHDPKIRIFFSTDIGGEGLDGMQGVCCIVVHYDDPLSLGKYEQRIGRVRRRGQKDPVLSIRFELAPEKNLGIVLGKLDRRFVDARIRDLIEWKSGQQKLIFDEGE